MDQRLKGKVTLLTGAAGGIGRAICERFAREGAIVAALDVDAAQLEELASGLRAEGGTVRAYPGDATNPDYIAKTVAAVHKEFGRIDILVNNLGSSTLVPDSQRPAAELSLEEWRMFVQFNLDTPFLFCKAVTPIMKAQRSGKIVNVSSLAAQGRGAYSGAGYAAAKGGVDTLTKKLALELGPFGINVNGIAPGMTLTAPGRMNWHTTRTEEQRQAALQQIPLRRVAVPEDQASVVYFLASSDSDYVSGVTINVAGGP